MKLTSKEESFAQNEASGKSKSQADSYRCAGYSANLTDKQVWEEASKLAKKPKVAQRIAELKQSLSDKSEWARLDSVTALRNVVEGSKAKPSDITGAVKVLNEMHGFNAAIKHEVAASVKINVSFD